jgi:hypothetical protein
MVHMSMFSDYAFFHAHKARFLQTFYAKRTKASTGKRFKRLSLFRRKTLAATPPARNAQKGTPANASNV